MALSEDFSFGGAPQQSIALYGEGPTEINNTATRTNSVTPPTGNKNAMSVNNGSFSRTLLGKKSSTNLWSSLRKGVRASSMIEQEEQKREEEEARRKQKEKETIRLSQEIQDHLMHLYLKEEGLTEAKLSDFLLNAISLRIPFGFDLKPFFRVPIEAIKKAKPLPGTLPSSKQQQQAHLQHKLPSIPPAAGARRFSSTFPPLALPTSAGPNDSQGGKPSTATLSRQGTLLASTLMALTRKKSGRGFSRSMMMGGKKKVVSPSTNNPLSPDETALSETEMTMTEEKKEEEEEVIYSDIIQPKQLLLLVQTLLNRDKEAATTDETLTDTYEVLCGESGDGGSSGTSSGLGSMKKKKASMHSQGGGLSRGMSLLARLRAQQSTTTTDSNSNSGVLSSPDMSPSNSTTVTKNKVADALMAYYPPDAARELAQVVVAYGTKESDIGAFVHSYREGNHTTMMHPSGSAGSIHASGTFASGGGSGGGRLLKVFFKLGGVVSDDGIPPTLAAHRLREYCEFRSAILNFSDSAIDRLIRQLDQDVTGTIDFDVFEEAVHQEKLRMQVGSGDQENSLLLTLIQKVHQSLDDRHSGGEKSVLANSTVFPSFIAAGKANLEAKREAEATAAANKERGGDHDGGDDELDWLFRNEPSSALELIMERMENISDPEEFDAVLQKTGSKTQQELEEEDRRRKENESAPRYMQPGAPHHYVALRRVDVDPRYAASIRTPRSAKRLEDGTIDTTTHYSPASSARAKEELFIKQRRGLPFDKLLLEGPSAQVRSEAGSSRSTRRNKDASTPSQLPPRPPGSSQSARSTAVSTTIMRQPTPPTEAGARSESGESARNVRNLSRGEMGLLLAGRRRSDVPAEDPEVHRQCRGLIRNQFHEKSANWATQEEDGEESKKASPRREHVRPPPTRFEAGEKKVWKPVRSTYYAPAIRTTPRWDKQQDKDFRERILQQKFTDDNPGAPVDYSVMLQKVLEAQRVDPGRKDAPQTPLLLVGAQKVQNGPRGKNNNKKKKKLSGKRKDSKSKKPGRREEPPSAKNGEEARHEEEESEDEEEEENADAAVEAILAPEKDPEI